MGDAGAHVRDDAFDIVAMLGQEPFGAGEFGQGQVEEFDADAGLPDVDADQQRAAGSDAQQRARPAAVGVDHSGLLQEAFGGEFGDDVADGT